MLDTPEEREELRRKLTEIWPDNSKNPVTIEMALRLLDKIASLERDADYLAQKLVEHGILVDNGKEVTAEGQDERLKRIVNAMGHINLWRKKASENRV